jgi:hypothetical protein
MQQLFIIRDANGCEENASNTFRRNTTVINRYELDQIEITRRVSSKTN